MIIHKFSNATLGTKVMLFKAYCTQIYGCPSWSAMFKYSYSKLRVAFRLLLKKPWFTSLDSYVLLCTSGFGMTSWFHIMGPVSQNQAGRYVSSSSSDGGTRGRSLMSIIALFNDWIILFNSCKLFHCSLETVSANETGVEPQPHIDSDTSVTKTKTSVTFDASGVNFYLRLGAVGKLEIVA